MKMAIVVSVLTSLALNYSFAEDAPALGNSKPLSFEELRESCTNPERFHSQRAPQQITIRCEDLRTVWVPSQPQSATMAQEQRHVKSSLLSDKYHVTENQSQVPLAARTEPCATFQEFKQNLVIQKKVSCDELVAFQGSLLELCLEHMDRGLKENPEILNEMPTGRMYLTCQGEILTQSLKAKTARKLPLANKKPVAAAPLARKKPAAPVKLSGAVKPAPVKAIVRKI